MICALLSVDVETRKVREKSEQTKTANRICQELPGCNWLEEKIKRSTVVPSNDEQTEGIEKQVNKQSPSPSTSDPKDSKTPSPKDGADAQLAKFKINLKTRLTFNCRSSEPKNTVPPQEQHLEKDLNDKMKPTAQVAPRAPVISVKNFNETVGSNNIKIETPTKTDDDLSPRNDKAQYQRLSPRKFFSLPCSFYYV